MIVIASILSFTYYLSVFIHFGKSHWKYALNTHVRLTVSFNRSKFRNVKLFIFLKQLAEYF